MTLKLTPPAFRREVERRLMDVRAVMKITGLTSPQGVRKRVRAGTLPPPVVSLPRSYALWDRDEIDQHHKEKA